MERKRKFKEIYQEESKDAILVANTIFAIMVQLSTINIINTIATKYFLITYAHNLSLHTYFLAILKMGTDCFIIPTRSLPTTRLWAYVIKKYLVAVVLIMFMVDN